MTLQACNLTSTTCCTNPVHAAVIRIACVQLQLHNQSSKTKWNICACLFACVDAVRHIPWSLYLAVLATQHVAQTLCSQKQHKNQEMAASRCNCTARVAQRSGIDVCAYSDGLDPSNRCCRLYLAVMACCTNPVHTAVFRTACRQRLLTNSSCKTC
jgi:hypothetical protein